MRNLSGCSQIVQGLAIGQFSLSLVIISTPL